MLPLIAAVSAADYVDIASATAITTTFHTTAVDDTPTSVSDSILSY